jgi:predicted transposase YbfD/YdcC
LTAARDLFAKMPELPGCMLSFDALHTTHQTMETVVIEKRADYLMQVKDNTPALKASLEAALNRSRPGQVETAETVALEHGRIEWRSIELVPISPLETGWPHTHQLARVTRRTEILRREQVVHERSEQALYVSSASVATSSPDTVLARIRGHWGIENGLHHRKDRSMDEDRNRASAQGIGRVMCCIRSAAALIWGRAKESAGVVRRRLSCKPQMLIGLLESASIADWERRVRPYKTA